MKKFIFAAILAAFTTGAFAQDAAPEAAPAPEKAWKTGGNGSFTFNQISFKNWAAGGKNSVTGTFLFKTFANLKTEQVTWDNTLDMGYGLTKYKSEDVQKSEDKLQLTSNFGYNAYKHKWFYSALFDFKTQFAYGYKYDGSAIVDTVSKFMAPAYLNVSIGMLYKPSDVFSLYISPLTGRTTIVTDTDFSTDYGLDAGKKARFEYGATAKMTVDKKNLVKNVDYFLTATAFSNLLDHPEHIDIDAETGFNLHVNDWLTAILKFNILFDDDIKYKEAYSFVDENGETQVGTRTRGARLQFKELFGFGLAFHW
ncbi:MAG: DUF3078 domain-containing protein [Bacteroidales bacterium]|nr:DUF3078 domain-containing protein [Bacteroidales bacterium]